jgi:hypothetical protein
MGARYEIAEMTAPQSGINPDEITAVVEAELRRRGAGAMPPDDWANLTSEITAAVVAPVRRATAYHEAGHAVIAVLCGIGVQHVTIKPSGTLWGHVQRSGGWSRIEVGDVTREECVRYGMFYLAGSIAEVRFAGWRTNWRVPGDYENMSRMAFKFCGTIEGAAELIAYLEAGVRRIIETTAIQNQIERVAAALLDRETLTGDELQQIISGDGRAGPPQV